MKEYLAKRLQPAMQTSLAQHKLAPAPPEAWKVVRGDPAQDFQKNRKEGDLHFRGVLMGAGIYTPNWSQAFYTLSPIVVAGTDCVTHYSDEEKLREAGLVYARRYNQLLTTYLIQVQHPLVLAAIRTSEETIQSLEKANPIQDARKALQKLTGPVLHLLSIENEKGKGETPGAHATDEKRLEVRGISVGYTPLPISMMFLNPMQRARVVWLSKNYISPYNRFLVTHAKRH